ncbi:MAG: tetratricopeptide repeat protein [Deltaproteobacteria bacterium]|nr:tetratricopeptide repeat protein [Deltaproteobacteria bacterium]MBW2020046.1 tetratricopeptide repeat protein [Deltaproteobacteria bacterium]MBW2074886.1 tetratricopeptide repeat protein [Deltaproteobacteria bacterium]
MSAETRIGRTGWLVAAATIMICLFPFYSHASPAVLLNPDRQFQFAEHYFQKGEYYRAIGEYERFIYFFPKAEQVELAEYRIGLAYLKGERYQEAIQVFKRLIEKYRTSLYAIKSYLRISEAYVQLKCYDEALINLENLRTIAPDQNIKDEAYYQCGWIYLEKGLWKNAQTCFDKISSQNREKYRLEQFLKELDKKKLLKRKDPAIAGLLAVVPGAGHLYCERYRDALASFLVNGALIFAAYEAFDHDQNALGGIITFVEVGFYSGNIYSAVSSAHKYNRDKKNRFLKYLKEHAKINISLEGSEGNKALMFSCRFSF